VSSPMARHSIAAPRLQIGGILIPSLNQARDYFTTLPKKIEVRHSQNRDTVYNTYSRYITT
jgi:hypothetical protein